MRTQNQFFKKFMYVITIRRNLHQQEKENIRRVAINYLRIVHLIVAKAKMIFYRGVDCMKKFCADLKKHAREIINNEKKEMLPLTDGGIESYNNKKFCHICRKKFHDVDDRDNNSNDDSDHDSDMRI